MGFLVSASNTLAEGGNDDPVDHTLLQPLLRRAGDDSVIRVCFFRNAIRHFVGANAESGFHQYRYWQLWTVYVAGTKPLPADARAGAGCMTRPGKNLA